MIDSIRDHIPGRSATGIKALKYDDWFFRWHMQQEPAMPGTLQTEAMLQTMVMVIYAVEGHEGKPSYVTETKTRMLSRVFPGSTLVIHADLLSGKREIVKGRAEGRVNKTTVCRGEFTFISPHEVPRPSN
jgi:3-hydroxyacyl-[acyl-carrier-protein] dehydratase